MVISFLLLSNGRLIDSPAVLEAFFLPLLIPPPISLKSKAEEKKLGSSRVFFVVSRHLLLLFFPKIQTAEAEK